jgi:hypothetical protein
MRRCYILGAGFSEVCGFPLARGLTCPVFESAYPVGNEQREQARRAYLDFLKSIYLDCDFETHWPDFEDMITLLDEWELYRFDYEGPKPNSTDYNPKHLKTVLLKSMGLYFCKILGECVDNQIQLIKDFVCSVVASNEIIVSFNWDLLIEVACRDLGVSINYGKDNEGSLSLIKPHGSLNLAEMSKDRYDKAKEAINVHSIEIIHENNGIVVVRAENPADSANRIIHPFKDVLLVEPTARKAYSSTWIKQQWQYALDVLRSADEIVIIGYSLPDTDFRPRILLQLAGLYRKKLPSVKIIDPNANRLICHYKRFSQLDIIPIEKSWKNWFIDMQANGGNITPMHLAEKMKERIE